MGAKAFNFKLKAVQDLRGRQLEQVQQRFALQQNRVIEVRELIEQIKQSITNTVKSSINDTTDPVLAQQRFRYLQYLREQVAMLTERLHQEEKKLEVIREEMRQAHVKKKSLDKLEEKQRDDYVKALASYEEKELEDLVMARGKRF